MLDNIEEVKCKSTPFLVSDSEKESRKHVGNQIAVPVCFPFPLSGFSPGQADLQGHTKALHLVFIQNPDKVTSCPSPLPRLRVLLH